MRNKRAVIVAGIAALVMMTAGCTESQVSGQAGSGSGGGGGGSTTTTTTGTGDVRAIVSTGPSLNFNNNTAGIVDVEVNPVTLLPSIVYLDRSAPMSGGLAVGALKYAYIDTYGNWNIEVIDINYGTAVCGSTGSFCVGAPSGTTSVASKVLDLAFTSAGNPIVAYAYGAGISGSKQMRFAERSSSGSWTVGLAGAYSAAGVATHATTIANIEPLRAVSLKVDSADRPHIISNFITATHTLSNLKHLTRISGVWYESDPIRIHNFASTLSPIAGVGALQSDFEICSAGSSGSSILLVGVVGAQSTINVSAVAATLAPTAYKLSVNLTTGVATSLEATRLFDGCSGNCFGGTPTTASRAAQLVAMDMAPSSAKPYVALTTTSNFGVFQWPVDCNASFPTAAGSWNTLSPISLANDSAGRFGLDLKAMGTDRVLAVYSATWQATASSMAVAAKMAPANTLAYSTAWTNFTPTTVDSNAQLDFTSLLAAAYDTGSASAYVGYGKLGLYASTVYGGDIILATAGSGDVGDATGGGFSKEVIDQTSFVASTMNAFPMLNAARASGSGGKVGAAFYYADPAAAIGGVAGGGDVKLYYITRGGTSSAPTFAIQPVVNFVESTTATVYGVGLAPTIAYDANSQPAIAFHNGSTVNRSLNVARTSNDGVTWSSVIVDQAQTSSSTVGMFASIQSASVSGTNALGVAYYDSANGDLKFARFTAQGGWRRFMVDGGTGATGTGCSTSADAGSFARLAFTSTGRPAIAYQRDSRLYVAYASEALTSSTYTWTCRWVDQSANTRGQGISFVLSSSNLPHIAHLDMSGFGSLRYVTSTSDIATAISTGDTAFSKEMVAATGNTVSFLSTPSIQVNSSGTRYIAYYSAVSGGLVLASKTSSASSWTTSVLEEAPTGASYSAASGQYASMVLNDNGLPMIFYRSKENWLKYFSRESE